MEKSKIEILSDKESVKKAEEIKIKVNVPQEN